MGEIEKGLLAVESPVELPWDPDAYRMGRIFVLVGQERAEGEERWHMSVSHEKRLPEWKEIKYLRGKLLPEDRFFCLPWPPEEFWVNIASNCLHLWEVRDPWLIEQMKADGTAGSIITRGRTP